MVVAVTGHRPSALNWGYDYGNKYWTKVKEVFKTYLLQVKATEVISGMALGMDTVAALATLELREDGYSISLRCAIPCDSQPYVWPKPSQDLYFDILGRAQHKAVLYHQEYKPWMMQKRNEYMVDECDVVFALFNGNKGGTYNCVKYAMRKNKPITTVSPADIETMVA